MTILPAEMALLKRTPTMNPVDMCKGYIEDTTRKGTEIGIFEFGINTYWISDQLVKAQNKGSGKVHEELRMDAVLIDVVQQKVRGFEFKVTHDDFISDKKWHKYLKYCNTFTFICPTEIIKKDELPAGIGLIYVEPNPNSYATDKVEAIWIQRPTRTHVNVEIYTKMIESMLQKAKYRQGAIL